jgi:hypothetical protein
MSAVASHTYLFKYTLREYLTARFATILRLRLHYRFSFSIAIESPTFGPRVFKRNTSFALILYRIANWDRTSRNPPLAENALENTACSAKRDDDRALHYLVKSHEPRSLMMKTETSTWIESRNAESDRVFPDSNIHCCPFLHTEFPRERNFDIYGDCWAEFCRWEIILAEAACAKSSERVPRLINVFQWNLAFQGKALNQQSRDRVETRCCLNQRNQPFPFLWLITEKRLVAPACAHDV